MEMRMITKATLWFDVGRQLHMVIVLISFLCILTLVTELADCGLMWDESCLGDRSHFHSLHSHICDRVGGLPSCGSWFDVGQQLHMVIVLISILYIFTLVTELADCRVAGRGKRW